MARFHYACPVRWSDMDAFGHVNNARFLTLYEEARVELFFNVAKASGMVFEEGVVVARQEIEYKRPVDYVPAVRIEMWIGEIRNSSFEICYEMFDETVLVSNAKTIAVLYDLAERRPRRINADEREYLETWQDVPQPARLIEPAPVAARIGHGAGCGAPTSRRENSCAFFLHPESVDVSSSARRRTIRARSG